MPFRITNAPASFQSWMNVVFKPIERLGIFFVDILVYNKNIVDDWTHLEEVFRLMSKNEMHVNANKYSFRVTKIEYLSHFISAQGVKTGPKKLMQLAFGKYPKV